MSAPREADDHALLDFIATRDVECPACGYNLRGLKVPVCPECAGRLYLAVGSENLALGPWALALVSFALAAGFDGVVGIVMSVALIRFTPAPPALRQALMMLGGFVFGAVVCGVGIWWLATRRRTVWGRVPRKRQWLAAWIIFGIVSVAHAVYGLKIAGII